MSLGVQAERDQSREYWDSSVDLRSSFSSFIHNKFLSEKQLRICI